MAKPKKEVVYQSASDAAERWGVSAQRVNVWLRADRVPGAIAEKNRLGKVTWLVPADAPRPEAVLPFGLKGKAK